MDQRDDPLAILKARAEALPDNYAEILKDNEVWWSQRCDLLHSRGYELRPRFRPGWVPSWRGTSLYPHRFEDSIRLPAGPVIDARRVSDGRVVCIKRVKRSSNEASIAQYLSQSEGPKDSRNHCIPIFDRFDDTVDVKDEFIVMPLLRPYENPEFYSTVEVLDFIRQTLEGTVYIHERNVAHRDLSHLNIMMDGDPLYPQGFHPVSINILPSYDKIARPLRRCDVSRVDYYITDFGLSTRFKDGESHLVTGCIAADKNVPELSDVMRYDPFRTDVFTLGNVYKETFFQVYTNLTFLEPLIVRMTRTNPDDRPAIHEAQAQFLALEATLTGFEKRRLLKKRNDSFIRRSLIDFTSYRRELTYRTKHFFTNVLP